jgi:hypothetical protein
MVPLSSYGTPAGYPIVIVIILELKGMRVMLNNTWSFY